MPNKEKSFEEQSAIVKKIIANGLKKYASEIQGLDRAFSIDDKTVRCIDEGTPGGLHLAGSGILMEAQQLRESLSAMGATGITSHAHCGAAGLYAKAQGLDPTKSDEYGREFARKLSEETGIPYAGHIDHLARPEAFHDAVACYYDLTGSFDPSKVTELPKGFVVNRGFLPAEYAKKELEVAISIATGDHGYGELITSENPFLVVVVGGSADMVEEAKAVSAKYGDKVRIETLAR